ncbi:uncharacterized protein LOC143649489 [Tamandua tetradactyla]|uniref:uncharacterized protein LOC143649489 n=1 Tax=Tamandua tetradactyla TaxID=48850 RepID=UPI0040548003
MEKESTPTHRNPASIIWNALLARVTEEREDQCQPPSSHQTPHGVCRPDGGKKIEHMTSSIIDREIVKRIASQTGLQQLWKLESCFLFLNIKFRSPDKFQTPH